MMHKSVVVSAVMLVLSGCGGQAPSSPAVPAGNTQPGAAPARGAAATASVAAPVAPARGAAATVSVAAPVAPARSTSRPSSSAATKAAQDPQEVLRILQERLRRLDNVIVEYDAKVTYPKLLPGEAPMTRPQGANFTIIRVTGVRGYVKKYMRLGDRTRYEETITLIEGAAQGPDWRPETDTDITTYTPTQTEYLGLDKDGKPVRGTISDPRPLPNPEIEIALGLRCHGQTDVLTSQILAAMPMVLPDDDHVVIHANDNENYTHEWTFLRSAGYALERYHRIPPPDSAVHHEVVCGDFREVDGMIMPYSMTLTATTRLPNEVRTNMTVEATIKAYQIGRPDNSPELYNIKWPNGTPLLNRLQSASQPASQAASAPTSSPAMQTIQIRPSPGPVPKATP